MSSNQNNNLKRFIITQKNENKRLNNFATSMIFLDIHIFLFNFCETHASTRFNKLFHFYTYILLYIKFIFSLFLSARTCILCFFFFY